MARAAGSLPKGCAKWFSERATDTYEPGWAVLQEKLLTVMRLDHVIMIRRGGRIPMEEVSSELLGPSRERLEESQSRGEIIAVRLASGPDGKWEFKGCRRWDAKGLGSAQTEWHAVLVGRKSNEGSRKVVTILADRWMFFDRSGGLARAPRDHQKGCKVFKAESAPAGDPSLRAVAPKVGDTKLGGVRRSDQGGAESEEGSSSGEEEPWTVVRKDGGLDLARKGADWYAAEASRREKLAEEAAEEAGIIEVKIEDSLRATWAVAQRGDPDLVQYFGRAKKSEDFAEGWRIAGDGLLERAVLAEPTLSGKNKTVWLPVVPGGYAAAHLSWRRWAFLQAHVGVFGGHRSDEKTIDIMKRMCWWKDMGTDVARWADKCLTCLRFNKRPTKQDQVAVKPADVQCWEEVMIDFEGPSTPEDKIGNKYVLTYVCCLSNGVLLEPVRHLKRSEVRRAFSRCILRSGTLPLLLRSDRGPEFRSLLIIEYSALVGIRHRLGTPWRPVEQGKVERAHQETQKVLGIMVQDVMKCDPSEWTECLPVVEFVLYNTPGPHGYTPRDIDRQWSLAVPLAKELQAFQVLEFEPVSDYSRNLFKAYRQIRAIVVGRLAESSAKRAQLANRYRKVRTVRVGDRVVYRDPRSRAAGGRKAWKEPLSEPCVVESVSKSGNKIAIRKSDGSRLDEVHVEDVVLLPESARDLERREPLEFEADEPGEPLGEDINVRRSVGEMLESAGRPDESKPAVKPLLVGKLKSLTTGQCVTYAVSPKKCRVGRVHKITRAESGLVVHQHEPMTDGKLRVKWLPVFVRKNGEKVLGNDDADGTPSLESVPLNKVVAVIQLNDGVMGHAVARKLDIAGYSLDETGLREERMPKEIVMLASARLEEFVRATYGILPVVEDAPGRTSVEHSGANIVFATKSLSQQWLAEGYVDFLEVFCGCHEFTLRIRECGLTAGEGLDSQMISYGQVWPLHVESCPGPSCMGHSRRVTA